VTRKVDSTGNVSFAGIAYQVGRAPSAAKCKSPSSAMSWRLPPAEKSYVHPIRHDRSREHGAFANAAADHPEPTPPNPTRSMEHTYRSQNGTRVPGLDMST
jgi:hypothetical protein